METKNPHTESQPNTAETTDAKNIATIAYITVLGLVIAYVMNNDKKTEFGAYHIRQSIGLMATAIAISIIAMVPFIGWIISILGSLALLYLWIMGLMNALNMKKEPLPWIGKKFEEWFKGI